MQGSRVLERSFRSHALGTDKRYCVYLPPGYDEDGSRHYATLYLLPGLMDWQRTYMEKAHLPEQMDWLLGEGRVEPMIVVMPDKDDAATAPEGEAAFEAYLSRELLAHIDDTYRTKAERRSRAIEGISLGAGWSMRLIVRHPELFSSVGSLSGGYAEETYQGIRYLHRMLLEEGTRFRIGAGRGEPEYVEDAVAFAQFLRDLGFPAELDLEDGPHDWPLWEKQLTNSLQFHSYSLHHV